MRRTTRESIEENEQPSSYRALSNSQVSKKIQPKKSCPRNCAEATTKDLGVVAIEGGKWEIYIGGAAGSRVRKGDVLCVVDTHEDVLLYMGRFMQYYREHAKYLERTYGFVERVGIERLRQILVEDSEKICARLDQESQAAVDAYVDPWLKEAYVPATPAQFVTALEPVGTI